MAQTLHRSCHSEQKPGVTFSLNYSGDIVTDLQHWELARIDAAQRPGDKPPGQRRLVTRELLNPGWPGPLQRGAGGWALAANRNGY